MGAGVIVLPGVTIGDNSVIGAGSVVTKDIPPNTVAVGSPCRVMRELTQEQVANYIGVNSKHLSSVERGERGLSISSLMDLCKFLDIEMCIRDR